MTVPRLLPVRWLAALRPEAASGQELPSDQVHEARRRVRITAAIGVTAYACFLALELSGRVPGSALEHRVDLTHDLLGMALCGLLLAIASLPALDDRKVLGAALAFEVALCTLISFAHAWAAFIRTEHLPGLTWVVPVILIFPLLVPAPPRVALLFSTLCALTMPGALAVLSALGAIRVAPSDYWATGVTCALAVGMSTIAARTVYGAGRQLAAARTLGSYRLVEPLAHGGMGEVWRAEHLFLARPAAIKRILPERLQGPTEHRDTAVQRFVREARATAGLRSPHTVELFDFGASEDGTLYYAMELLDGMNAEHFVYRFGPLEPRRAVHWLRQACHSLGEAHARGLIHRDIKPANLFICRYGRDADWVKVLDFGLSRPSVALDDPRLTQAGRLLGTPGYIAPEQLFGLEDRRTDLYALGCVAWWLLAGSRPFESDHAGELLRQHAQAEPPPLSSRAAQPIPPRLEALVMACLAKRPEDRPADADQLRDALGTSLDDDPWSQPAADAWWTEHLDSGR